jgi:HTH-type transcriptional regulator/antitoxin HipB
MEYFIPTPKVLGTILQGIRKSKKVTQSEVGVLFGLEQTTVSSIENGAAGTRLDTLFRLLAALDLEMIIKPKNKEKKGGGW